MLKTRPKRLRKEVRRDAILDSIRDQIAKNGFEGITTHDLARSAGISEALLFKHFPDKKAIYSSLLISCFKKEDSGCSEKIMQLEPSTENLVVIVHMLVSKIILGWFKDGDDININRLILRSILEDGLFANAFIRKQFYDYWIVKFKECLEAAQESGDIIGKDVIPELMGWFVHHLPFMIATFCLPQRPVVEYGISKEELIEQTAKFLLRGIGLNHEIIRKCYESKDSPFMDKLCIFGSIN